MNSVNETMITLENDWAIAIISRNDDVRGESNLLLLSIRFLYHRNLSLGKDGLHQENVFGVFYTHYT